MRRMLGGDGRLLTGMIALRSLRRLGPRLRMPAYSLLLRALCALAWQGWKKQRGSQTVAWRSGMTKLYSALDSAVDSRFPGWDPRNANRCSSGKLRNMTQRGSDEHTVWPVF